MAWSLIFFEIFWKYLEQLFYSTSVNSIFHLLKRLQDLNSTFVLNHGSIGNDFNNFKIDFPVQVQVFYYPMLGSTALFVMELHQGHVILRSLCYLSNFFYVNWCL